MIKAAKVPVNGLEVLKNARFQLKYLYVNLSSTSGQMDRERAQRRQATRQRRVQRDREAQLERRTLFNRGPVQAQNNEV